MTYPMLRLVLAVSAMLALASCSTDPLSSDHEPVPAARVVSGAVAGTCEQCGPFPAFIRLPDGFGPEGIARGRGTTFFAGSMLTGTAGQILTGDMRTGRFEQLVAPSGRPLLGMKYDERSDLLFVSARGPGGALVYDATTGSLQAEYAFGPATSAMNDVILTRDAAYFTDSQAAVLYRVALSANGQPGAMTSIALPANFATAGTCTVGPPLKSNGIAASPDGRFLVLVHMSEGVLYRMDTTTDELQAVALSGGDVCSTDGMLLDGSTLYVVQNFLHRVAVIELSDDLLSGTVTRHLTAPFARNPRLRVPTTIADFGDVLYAVTAGFAPPAPDYVVRIDK